MTGRRETIAYRITLVRTSRSNEFLPAQGIGAGLGEGLGIVLNRVIRKAPSYRVSQVVRQVTGMVIAETPEYVTLELPNGRKLKIRVSDIIRRKVFDK